MSGFHDAARSGLSATGLEAVLRQAGAERYHNRHPFHHRMTAGALSKIEMQAWALNRYCYQAVIPRKDAMIIARAEDPTFRAAWRKRIEDHDGEDGRSGGVARWLHLATSVGLDADAVESERLALPATRFAVGAYLSFCTNRTLLEAVASSLTELFSPVIIGERVPAMLAKYDYITEDTLAYFKARPEQASRDSRLRSRLCAAPCRHTGAPAGGDRRAGVQMRCSLGHARRTSARLWRGERHPARRFPAGGSMMTAPHERAIVSLRSVPSLPKHVRIQLDPVRQAFAVLSPERVFWPNGISLDILRRCDGRSSVGEIIADLAVEYDAMEADVAADVTAFLQEWSDKLLVKL